MAKSKETKILEEALEKAAARTLPRKARRKSQADLPLVRHEHAIIKKVPTETPNLVPGGIPMRP